MSRTPLTRPTPSHPDYDIFKKWMADALAAYPDQTVAKNTELIVDGYDVADKLEFPPRDKLVAGPDSYDVVMMTGASALPIPHGRV